MTDPAGGPVGGVYLDVYDASRADWRRWVGWAQTNADGTYTVGGLDTGQYHVVFYAPRPYATEFWNDRPSMAAADVVDVTFGADTGGIDAQLSTGATISGHVTGQEGQDLEHARVMAYRADERGWLGICRRREHRRDGSLHDRPAPRRHLPRPVRSWTVRASPSGTNNQDEPRRRRRHRRAAGRRRGRHRRPAHGGQPRRGHCHRTVRRRTGRRHRVGLPPGRSRRLGLRRGHLDRRRRALRVAPAATAGPTGSASSIGSVAVPRRILGRQGRFRRRRLPSRSSSARHGPGSTLS